MPRTSENDGARECERPGVCGPICRTRGVYGRVRGVQCRRQYSAVVLGLPDDRCQAPHWGVVISGRLVFTYADHTEVIEAGDAYYAQPGHTPAAEPGTETIEFSPTDALHKTMAVVMSNAQALSAKT